MLRLYNVEEGEGGGGDTMRVMYATQEHNLLAQRSHKLYISHHHKTKAWKPTEQKQKKTATANACIQETGFTCFHVNIWVQIKTRRR